MYVRMNLRKHEFIYVGVAKFYICIQRCICMYL